MSVDSTGLLIYPSDEQKAYLKGREDGYNQAIEDATNRLLNLKYRGVLGESEVVAAIEAVEGTDADDESDDDSADS